MDKFENVLDYFRTKEAPEAILFVGDDEKLIKIPLSWQNIAIELKQAIMALVG